jgi:hypothetical protein
VEGKKTERARAGSRKGHTAQQPPNRDRWWSMHKHAQAHSQGGSAGLLRRDKARLAAVRRTRSGRIHDC